MVVRDAEGSVIVASAKWYNHMADALTREFLAARDRLNLAAQQSLVRVILECDNLPLFNMLRRAMVIVARSMDYGKRSKSSAGLVFP